MKTVECTACRQSLPMNDTFSAGGRCLCEMCADPHTAVRQVDPTICIGCRLDNGSNALAPLASGLPVCGSCRDAFLERPIPRWVKVSLALLLLLAAFSFVRNWRFLAGYREMKQAAKALGAGDLVQGAQLMSSAARHVPEEPGLAHAASLDRAMALIRRERSAEALPLLRSFKAQYQEPGVVDNLLVQAEMAAAFERKDYEAFVEKAQSAAASHPGTVDAFLMLASAYGCKYALTGELEYKNLTLRNLEEAKRKAGAQSAALAGIEQRLEHRLATREILGPSEFKRRYPRGWKKNTDIR